MGRISRNNRKTYDDLCWKYKDYVVLILKQFMYKGYDNSARVLSFIMGYKLYESRNGITAAGPDKDKILRDLSYYHINYVISEYGEITEFRSFPDNSFDRYLAMSNNLPVAEASWIDEEGEDKEGEDKRKGTREQLQETDSETTPCSNIPSWLVPGLSVFHKKYGTGRVSSVDEGSYIRFSICFDDNLEKRFIFPEAFAQGFVSFVDE